ncbi:carbonic anhydrase family protein [Mixta sp. Marseille-Q2659]|uniref:carbonic anhydrase n=1 Tax=Mixta sp. Marseille-Q2659 TaxID=2736607 RepID=UPI0023B9D444|nr:carbonic anhydrase family protein [Mixta sp. Marseille-Q2659]
MTRSYEGKGSPEHWGELSEQWQTCKEGMYQSPINISHPVSANLPPLDFNFHTNVKSIVNNGHTIQITVHDEDDFLLDGQIWNLKQFHFHSPSENHINGQRFPLELHFFHANSQGELAVLAVMLTPGKTNPALDILLDVLPTTVHQEQALQQDMMLEKRFPQDKHYYRFSGSLTTPPCTEGFICLVMKRPVEASHAQLARFARALRNANNRPLQPLHGRQITE